MDLVRQIEKLLAISIAKMPTELARRLGSDVEVDGQTLDPHLKLLFGLGKRRGGFETKGSVAAARHEYRNLVSVMERPEDPADNTQNRKVETDAGPVPIRIYQCTSPGPRPCVIYFHGGGYVIGDLETHDGLCRRFSRDLSATVIAVDYRLAPEHPFPAGVDDCVAVANWVINSADTLGIDKERIALAGDSAGGNFAAVVSQEVSGLAFQLLIYPGTDSLSKSPSRSTFSEGYALDTSTTDWFSAQYSQESDRAEPRVSPAKSKELSQSPPTHIAVAGFDVLRDEGREYAQQLQAAGVDCSIEIHGSLSHGFVHFSRIPGCDLGVRKLVEDLRRGLDLA